MLTVGAVFISITTVLTMYISGIETILETEAGQDCPLQLMNKKSAYDDYHLEDSLGLMNCFCQQ